MPFKLITYIRDVRVSVDTFPTREKAEEEGENNLVLFADAYLLVEVDEHGKEVQ